MDQKLLKYYDSKRCIFKEISHLLHICGNKNEIHRAESELRDTQKYINHFSATKSREQHK